MHFLGVGLRENGSYWILKECWRVQLLLKLCAIVDLSSKSLKTVEIHMNQALHHPHSFCLCVQACSKYLDTQQFNVCHWNNSRSVSLGLWRLAPALKWNVSQKRMRWLLPAHCQAVVGLQLSPSFMCEIHLQVQICLSLSGGMLQDKKPKQTTKPSPTPLTRPPQSQRLSIHTVIIKLGFKEFISLQRCNSPSPWAATWQTSPSLLGHVEHKQAEISPLYMCLMLEVNAFTKHMLVRKHQALSYTDKSVMSVPVWCCPLCCHSCCLLSQCLKGKVNLSGGDKVSDFCFWQNSNQAFSSKLFSSLSLLLQILIIIWVFFRNDPLKL